ncbi:helix-turn-helix transcriptional regulator [Nonomuraea sp. MTCD27]|uniref:helix-turn-helix transcriptional regulator n=1 Tax=Nonomuraea sp. MTCD27 TaxID=1676747 RepID=UPI0035BF8EFC
MNDQTRTMETGPEVLHRPDPRAVGAAPSQQLVVGLMEAARLLGMGRTTAYRLAKTGTFPCPVLRIGGRYAVPLSGLRALLGYDTQHNREPHDDSKG